MQQRKQAAADLLFGQVGHLFSGRTVNCIPAVCRGRGKQNIKEGVVTPGDDNKPQRQPLQRRGIVTSNGLDTLEL